MAGVQQDHDASSGDTVVSQNPSEKAAAETPLPAQEPEQEMAVQHDAENKTEDNVVEKQPSGAPLDRTPSQAQRMGKKKIAVVMTALCVRILGPRHCAVECDIVRTLTSLSNYSWLCFSQLWIWYAIFTLSRLFRSAWSLIPPQTIISTALPTIAAKFHASESGYSWIASSYLLANAACIPLWGKVSDIWGRKPIILLANVAFLVGSLICALAKNMAMIVAGRAVQGIGGGGIIILANISVSDLFSMRYVQAIFTSNISVPLLIHESENVLCTTVSSVLPGLLPQLWVPSSVVLSLLMLPGGGASG